MSLLNFIWLSGATATLFHSGIADGVVGYSGGIGWCCLVNERDMLEVIMKCGCVSMAIGLSESAASLPQASQHPKSPTIGARKTQVQVRPQKGHPTSTPAPELGQKHPPPSHHRRPHPVVPSSLFFTVFAARLWRNPTEDRRIRLLEADIKALCREWGVCSVRFAFVHRDEVLLARGFGEQDEKLDPVTADAIGSTTKLR
ncbi:hypothetical protein BDK51DRAFT_50816 [Blyttiomyces helicus]|uniref:Uncharacterized protein n=1 Tax=Blyttiomyces helicus TaxID=388810 RepID=A0A4P9W532_9FUNG|nr:hypothetical protein BDK51DRAFT_50816 [Blyttiomyces helicus]|eukprot:RKO87344.1 hypothetical protein BDK51DRAFT_50816 [Blyttiomyces helicus]